MPLTELEYWKKRCEAAEKYIDECPCDPDILIEQHQAWVCWQAIKDTKELLTGKE